MSWLQFSRIPFSGIVFEHLRSVFASYLVATTILATWSACEQITNGQTLNTAQSELVGSETSRQLPNRFDSRLRQSQRGDSHDSKNSHRIRNVPTSVKINSRLLSRFPRTPSVDNVRMDNSVTAVHKSHRFRPVRGTGKQCAVQEYRPQKTALPTMAKASIRSGAKLGQRSPDSNTDDVAVHSLEYFNRPSQHAGQTASTVSDVTVGNSVREIGNPQFAHFEAPDDFDDPFTDDAVDIGGDDNWDAVDTDEDMPLLDDPIDVGTGEDDWDTVDINGDGGAVDGPFELIETVSEPMRVTVRRSLLLRTRMDIYRTAVVDPSVCDLVQFTPREVSIAGKQVGSTNVTFWFKDGGQQPMTYLVQVQPDLAARRALEDEYRILAHIVNKLFPDSKVELFPIANKLIVRGQAKDSREANQIMQIIRREVRGGNANAAAARSIGGDAFATPVLSSLESGNRATRNIRVVNLLRVSGPQQVALKVKFAELNRTAARGFGVNVDAQINITDTGGLFIQSMLNMAGGDSSSVVSQFDGDDITFGIRFLEQEGVLRMLSEPTLVTLSGRAATFVAGGEFAVPTVVGVGGVGAVATDFRTFGAIISFLPVVIDKDLIRLEVSPEFSQINAGLNSGSTFGLDVRAVTTTVEMREGQTLAIAGLLDDSMTANKSGDLPFISHLFGRRDISHNETELLILVTPELVHPMEPEEVPPLPGFDVTEPNNHEFYFQGHLEGNPTQQFRSTIWPRLRFRYQGNGPAMVSGPFGHGQ